MKGKKTVLGVTGSIAAYKACEIIRLLIKEEAEVKVVMTESSKKFISPLTLRTLSRNEVACSLFQEVTPPPMFSPNPPYSPFSKGGREDLGDLKVVFFLEG